MSEEKVKQFKENTIYRTRSIGDHNCIFIFKVLKRTVTKTGNVWVTVHDNLYRKTARRKVSIYEGKETCRPCGRYSFAPIINADDDNENNIK